MVRLKDQTNFNCDACNMIIPGSDTPKHPGPFRPINRVDTPKPRSKVIDTPAKFIDNKGYPEHYK